MRRRTPALLALALGLALGPALTACGSGADASPSSAGTSAGSGDALVVYSGRNENLVGPLLADLEKAVGTDVQVRYGESSQLAAQLLEEGTRTQADVFYSQDAGSLGALAKAGRLAALDQATLTGVPERYRDEEGRWVGTSARSRVVAYDPRQVPTPPASVDALLEPAYKGKIGFAPTNASFQAFVTALRLSRGEDGARTWLERFKGQEPRAYDRNGLVLDAVNRGEVSVGLINHYYWYEKVAEEGEKAVNARLQYLPPGDPGALVNVAGAGVIEGSDRAQAAQAAVKFLLSKQAQQYVADVTAEYPVIPGVTSKEHTLRPLAEGAGARVDLNDLDSLDRTLALLDEVGLT